MTSPQTVRSGPPFVAVVGLPGLVAPLRRAGYRLLADGSTDPATVVKAARAAEAQGQNFVALVASPDPTIRPWIGIQVVARRRVLIVVSDRLPYSGDPIEGTRTRELPATVDEIMGAFGAPPVGDPHGTVLIADDGHPYREPEPEPQQPPEPVDPFDDPAAGWGAAPATTASRPAAPDMSPPDTAPAAYPAQEHHQPPPPVQPEAVRPEAVRPVQPLIPPRTRPEQPAGPDPFTPPVVRPVAQPPAPQPVAQRVPPAAFPQTVPRPVAPPPEYPAQRPGQATQPVPQQVQPPSWRPEVTAPTGAPRTALAELVISLAAKGGVGKTSSALALAQRAVDVGGIRKVVVIDANRGQGDIRKYLRLERPLRSIYDAALAGDPASAIISPKRLNEARNPALPRIGFGVVLAPQDDQADPNVVTTAVYRRVVEQARQMADLVVMDTQIVEAWDTSDLIDGMVVPLLASSAWALALSDTSMAGVDNLVKRLQSFSASGVDRSRVLFAINRANQDSALQVERLHAVFGGLAVPIGTIPMDGRIGASFETGRIPHDSPEMAHVLDEVLYRVTGLDAFENNQPNPSSRRRGGVGFFSRRKP